MELRIPASKEPLHMTLAPLGRRSRKEWILSGVSCNGFFIAYCHFASRTPSVIKHLHGWRGRKHRHWSTPRLKAVQPVSEGLGKTEGQVVRQALYRQIATTMVCWERTA